MYSGFVLTCVEGTKVQLPRVLSMPESLAMSLHETSMKDDDEQALESSSGSVSVQGVEHSGPRPRYATPPSLIGSLDGVKLQSVSVSRSLLLRRSSHLFSCRDLVCITRLLSLWFPGKIVTTCCL